MPIAKLDKKVEGRPVKVGTSKGGMHAFMAGVWCITLENKTYERPVVFVNESLNPDTIPDIEQLLSIDQLSKFSQPGTWQWDDAAIAQAKTQLKTLA